MRVSVQPAAGFSHDAMDSFVAALAAFCARLVRRRESVPIEVAFSDEWERAQIARELHHS
jgi:hypothetical protein